MHLNITECNIGSMEFSIHCHYLTRGHRVMDQLQPGQATLAS